MARAPIACRLRRPRPKLNWWVVESIYQQQKFPLKPLFETGLGQAISFSGLNPGFFTILRFSYLTLYYIGRRLGRH